MTPPITSAASAPTIATLPVRRPRFVQRTHATELPTRVTRLLATGTGTTPIVAAFQSSV